MDTKHATVIRLPPPPGVQRAPKRPVRRSSDEDDLWLVSYGDLLTLLFCFFTLLLSMSNVDAGKMDQLQSTIDQKYGKQNQKGLSALHRQIEQVAQQVGLSEDVRVRRSERGLVVDLNARILFTPGSAELSERAQDLLDELAMPLKAQPIEIEVEGHTDPVPISTSRFPSNWELSSARASSVVRYLITAVGYDSSRLRAVGLADTVPVDGNGEPLVEVPPPSFRTEEYLARQRRVALVLSPLRTAAVAQESVPAGAQR